METTVKQRLIDFINQKGISIREFERACGLSNGYINALNANIGTEKLHKILCTYKDLNSSWLLSGVGDMFVGEAGNIYTQNNSDNAHDNVQNNNDEKYLELLKMQGEQLSKAQEQLSTAQEQVNRLLNMLDSRNE